FGNLTDADIKQTVDYCTQLTATGGIVVWTRGRRWAKSDRDLFPQICDWFEERGFDRLWRSDPQFEHRVAAHRFTGTPTPPSKDAIMFTFVGWDPQFGPPKA